MEEKVNELKNLFPLFWTESQLLIQIQCIVLLQDKERQSILNQEKGIVQSR